MSTYETALRDCLRDCGAILQTYLEGKLRYEATGQVKALVRDIDLLLGREDCPSYDYIKGLPFVDAREDPEAAAALTNAINEVLAEDSEEEIRARHLWRKERDDK